MPQGWGICTEVCSGGGQGWSKRSAPAKERVEMPVLIVNVSEVVVVAYSPHDGPQMAVRVINGPSSMPKFPVGAK